MFIRKGICKPLQKALFIKYESKFSSDILFCFFQLKWTIFLIRIERPASETSFLLVFSLHFAPMYISNQLNIHI